MNNLDDLTIFIESSEMMGLLYNNYKHLPDVIKSFLEIIDSNIRLLLLNPYEVTIDMNEDIAKFKRDIDIIKTPEEIYTDDIITYKKDLKKIRGSIDDILNTLVKLKDKVSFGGNFVRGILNRPKVYSKDMDHERYEIINNNIRSVNRALDWVEKITIDLYNLIDQDLNILTIINKIYIKKHIYEEVAANEPPDVKSVDDAEIMSDDVKSDEINVTVDDVENEAKEKSLPKQTDAKESNKNGVKRKQLYIAFIEHAKSIHSNNLFGSVFDKDAFTLYSFVPQEMRYFYRLANPLLCVLEDSLTFFSLSELKKINSENKDMDKLLIFAADKNDRSIVFNTSDKKIYKSTHNDNIVNTESMIAESFDEYIESLVGIKIISESFIFGI